MPAYNEGEVIEESLADVVATLDAAKHDFEIVVVDDGSSDATRKRVADAASKDSRISLESYQPNRGKGYALRQGYKRTTGAIVAFYDADLDIPPRCVVDLLAIMGDGAYDAVVGSKSHPSSNFTQGKYRRLLSRGARWLIRTLVRSPITDTQVGVKVFKRRALESVMAELTIDKYAFDIELLTALHYKGFKLAEGPVTIVPSRTASKVGKGAAIVALKDAFVIAYRMRRRRRPSSSTESAALTSGTSGSSDRTN